MKKYKNFHPIIFIAVVAAVLLPVNACKKPVSPLEGLELIIDYNLIKTTTDVQFTDVTTGQTLSGEASRGAYVSYDGPGKEMVVDVLGIAPANKQFAINRGIATLAYIPGQGNEPSMNKSIDLNLITHIPGYLTTVRQSSVTKTGRSFVNVNVVPLDNPPSGVHVRQAPNATNTQHGRVVVPVEVQTPGGNARVIIPEGMLVRDANGNQLQGNLNVTLVRFDNTNPTAQKCLPGGTIPRVQRQDGSLQKGMFFSAGFVAVEISDEAGRKAASFDDGTVTLVKQIDPQTYNPLTRTTVAPGDKVSVWSLNEETGNWKEEGLATAELVNNKLQFTAYLKHLSYYHFAWFTETYCPSGKPVSFVTDAPLPAPFLIKGSIYRQEDNAFIDEILFWVENDQPLFITNAPAGTPVYIEWDTEGSPFINVAPDSQVTYIDDLCSSQPVTVNLYITQDPNQRTVNIHISLFCPTDPIVTIKPTFTAYYVPSQGSQVPIPVEMVEGVATIPGIYLGESYYVWVVYDGEEYGTDVVVTQDTYTYLDYEIPAEICDEINGL